jgi:hypothetical protein
MTSLWETVNELVQQEPAGAGEPETMGLLAAVGIVKGKPFAPDERMRKILQDAVVVGNATARTVSFAPRAEDGFAYYPDSAWFNMLFTGGYEFLDPPPQITADGPVASPSDGARKLNSRIAFFYPYTGITPAMCMRLPGVGSQYLIAMRDSDGQFLDGDRTYRLTLPPDIPESRFWSVMLYDRQTRSMLQTDLYSVGIGVVSARLRFGCAGRGRGGQASALQRRARGGRWRQVGVVAAATSDPLQEPEATDQPNCSVTRVEKEYSQS